MIAEWQTFVASPVWLSIFSALMQLAELMRSTVKRRFGIELEQEPVPIM
jgi:hypothetical protein